jgi:hypothetical protein
MDLLTYSITLKKTFFSVSIIWEKTEECVHTTWMALPLAKVNIHIAYDMDGTASS